MSSQCGMMAYPSAWEGRHSLPLSGALPLNCKSPFELTFTSVKFLSYRRYVNGSVTEVVQSSQWLPISTVPGTIVPVACTRTYWPPPHTVCVGVGVKVGVAEGMRVCVLVAVGGVPV